jgi:hypothetical protein
MTWTVSHKVQKITYVSYFLEIDHHQVTYAARSSASTAAPFHKCLAWEMSTVSSSPVLRA